MEFGVVLQGVYAPGTFRSLAAEIEGLGYTHLWVTDSSLHARDAYVYLTLAATATERLTLGTAVTNPLTRHPAISANAAATLAAIAPRRVILGMGAGDRPLQALGLEPAKPAVVRKTIEVCRALLAGDHVTTRAGEVSLQDAYLHQPCDIPPPIWLAASGPQMLRLAGAAADGVIILAGLFPEGIAYALRHVNDGRSGEKGPAEGGGFGCTVFMYGSMDEDTERTVESARAIAAWFPQTAPHYCELAGMDRDLIEQVRAHYEGGEFQEAKTAAALIPADLVQRLVLAGGQQYTIEKVEMLAAQGVRNVGIFPLGDDRLGMVRDFARQVMPAFHSAPGRG